MTTKSCENCVNWCVRPHHVENHGECRAQPPVSPGRGLRWPMTTGDEWCGVFVPRPVPAILDTRLELRQAFIRFVDAVSRSRYPQAIGGVNDETFKQALVEARWFLDRSALAGDPPRAAWRPTFDEARAGPNEPMRAPQVNIARALRDVLRLALKPSSQGRDWLAIIEICHQALDTLESRDGVTVFVDGVPIAGGPARGGCGRDAGVQVTITDHGHVEIIGGGGGGSLSSSGQAEARDGACGGGSLAGTGADEVRVIPPVTAPPPYHPVDPDYDDPGVRNVT